MLVSDPLLIATPPQVISGQQLPKPGDKKGEVIDPYVVLQMTGAECDTQRVKTKTISDNGVCVCVRVCVCVCVCVIHCLLKIFVSVPFHSARFQPTMEQVLPHVCQVPRAGGTPYQGDG